MFVIEPTMIVGSNDCSMMIQCWLVVLTSYRCFTDDYNTFCFNDDSMMIDLVIDASMIVDFVTDYSTKTLLSIEKS
jgi:hypothetical protein